MAVEAAVDEVERTAVLSAVFRVPQCTDSGKYQCKDQGAGLSVDQVIIFRGEVLGVSY